KSICHSHYCGFLKPQNITEMIGEISEHGQFRRTGIAKNSINTNGREKVEHGISDGITLFPSGTPALLYHFFPPE
ncbi:MAG: hypothetical protein M3Z49_11740, partial [Bifidobacteriales bacterium]|nr:hypothetical protein [Bifidobacteriales bacterium]